MSKPYPICVSITTGRSGSTYLANAFQASHGQHGGVLHESLHPARARTALHHRLFDGSALDHPPVAEHLASLQKLAESGPLVDFGWVLGCLAPACRQAYGSRLRVLRLTHHPVSVAASFAVRGHYQRNKSKTWAISPLHERVVYPQYAAAWPNMSSFEKGLYRWLEITQFGLDFQERFPEVPCLALRSSEVFSNRETLRKIADFIGFTEGEVRPQAAKNEVVDQHLERWPMRDEWKKTFAMPDVVALAERLGFDMSESELQRIAGKYQLQGLMPRVRHWSGYWAARESLGALRSRLSRGRSS